MQTGWFAWWTAASCPKRGGKRREGGELHVPAPDAGSRTARTRWAGRPPRGPDGQLRGRPDGLRGLPDLASGGATRGALVDGCHRRGALLRHRPAGRSLRGTARLPRPRATGAWPRPNTVL